MTTRFRALLVEEQDGAVTASFKDLGFDDLPEGDVLVEVAYSSLNYKDGLALSGRGKIVRRYPMVPGVDLAGVVRQSASPRFKPGDPVIATGWGLGERYWGGYSQFQRLRSEWLMPLPEGFDLKRTMAVGSAGLTSMLCVMALEHAGVQREDREVLVTGAAGGVGSLAIALLAARGFRVAASTGRPEEHDFLRSLGATTILERHELSQAGPPLASQRWAGAIDTVGGQTLASVLSQTAYGGAVAACGLVGGSELPATVYPFILRNVALLGVECVQTPQERRHEAWRRLYELLSVETLDGLTEVVPLSELPSRAPVILGGKVRGRVVVDVKA